MKLNHAKALINEPRYLEAQKVIAEAEAVETKESVIDPEPIVADELPVEDQEPGLQERVD